MRKIGFEGCKLISALAQGGLRIPKFFSHVFDRKFGASSYSLSSNNQSHASSNTVHILGGGVCTRFSPTPGNSKKVLSPAYSQKFFLNVLIYLIIFLFISSALK